MLKWGDCGRERHQQPRDSGKRTVFVEEDVCWLKITMHHHALLPLMADADCGNDLAKNVPYEALIEILPKINTRSWIRVNNNAVALKKCACMKRACHASLRHKPVQDRGG